MKKFYFFSVFALISFFAAAQSQPFITTWEVAANDLSITIPTQGSGYNYTVDFGDGTVLNNVTGDTTHFYGSAGTYTVSISGSIPRIYFDGSFSNSTKISSIEQWGDIQWMSMESAFQGCTYLALNATDAPDLSQVTDMSICFPMLFLLILMEVPLTIGMYPT